MTIPSEPPRRSTGRSHRGMSKQGVDDDNGHDDDDRGQDDKKSSKRQETALPKQSFACPFAKADPVTHLSCLHYTMSRIGDVKSHIQKHHMIPVHCPRCGLVFDCPGRHHDDDRMAHIQAQACNLVNVKLRPGLVLSPAQMGQLRNCGEASRTGSRYERRWYGIWDFLFPDLPAPATPYAGSEFQERMDLAAADVASDNYIYEFANGFPVGRRQDIHDFSNSLVQRFRSYAARQEDSRVTTMGSPNQVLLESHIKQAETLRQPAAQLEYDSHHGPTDSQMGDWSLSLELDGPMGDEITPAFPSGGLSGTLSPGLFGNNTPNDNTHRGYGSSSNGYYTDYGASHHDYYPPSSGGDYDTSNL